MKPQPNTKETKRMIGRLIPALFALAVTTTAGSAARGGTDATHDTAAARSTVAPMQANTDQRRIVGTIVWFSSNRTSVNVTIDKNNPAVRDFLSMLPLTLTVKEFSGREKIGYLPRKLRHRGSPGSDPKNGDLIYFVPWGNLGFYYNAEGIGYSDATIHLGTYRASREQLKQLEGRVTVKVAEGVNP